MALAPLAFTQGHSQSKIVTARAQVLSLSHLTQDLSNGGTHCHSRNILRTVLVRESLYQSLLFLFSKRHCGLEVFPANCCSLLTFYPSQQFHGKSFAQQIPSSSTFLLLGGPKLTQSMIFISLWTNSSRKYKKTQVANIRNESRHQYLS